MTSSGASPRYALIAGSGFRDFATDSASQQVDTRYGSPSSPVRELEYGRHCVYLIARHGENLQIPAHRVNYRANLAALESLGVNCVVAVNTVGVINESLEPGQLAVPDQLIDYTWGRDHSIHDGNADNLQHIDFTEPFCAELRRKLLTAADAAGVACHDGGTYAVTQGPRLETAAEVDRLARDGADFVGMTAMPEAALAMEMGMRYACLSLIVNYGAGRGQASIHEDLHAYTATARMLSMKLLREFFHRV
ncbi:MAG: S-methyl-5'-thioinosine phosphorylase [Gammaproteobacteria bacterium]|nr:S-methyl-5'-thioinosine phosphorylase [Gammaproteobacteria bacterium]MDH4313516.1 S-methyl-5'-thioinosine phosphorylase [Gammaproteobacteria bacterium]MDH5212585.1 S-methyl-5'-thioinosine phosphorylase [Gammaproteobacteria bacterium]